MPWNDDNDSRGPRNPWGQPDQPQRPRGGGGDRNNGGLPPELEEMLRRAQENFNRLFPQGGGAVRAALLAATVAIILWLASGFYFVQPNENAVVLTFGRYAKTETQAGLKYAFPWPVQQAFKVDVTSERRVEIGFRSPETSRYVTRAAESGNESLMLTGDENIIDIEFVVMWRVGDAKQFLFELRAPEDTIKMVAESAIREIIARTNITAALTGERGQIQADTKALMQKILDEYQSGVVINNVQLLKVDPPGQVIDAFNDVQRARTEAERMENEAQAYRNDILPRARGEAQKTLEDAEAYRQETIARAKGDADRFNAVFAAYSKSKDVTTQRLYLETIEAILQNAKTIVMDDKRGNGVVPYLPINELGRNRAGAGMPPPPNTSSSDQGGLKTP